VFIAELMKQEKGQSVIRAWVVLPRVRLERVSPTLS
jgi:hypothetical protein